MNPTDDLIYTKYLFIVFLVSLLLLILSGLFEYYFYIRKSLDGPIYKRKQTLHFRLKKSIGTLLMKFNRHDELPDHLIDKLMVFNDKDEMPVDAVYFNTSSEGGQILLFATARRRNGLVNTIGILKIPEFSSKLLVLPIFPKTSLHQTKGEQNNLDYYTVAGIKIKSVVPKKEYQIEYKGKMVMDSSFRKEIDVEMSAVWRSNGPTFNYSTEMSDVAKSEAMALEPWSHKYFNNLKSYHQHHYEQFGNLEGVVKIEGKQYSLQCSGVRDHTVAAKRDWNEFHNYVFHFIRLSNGNSISVGVICVPVMFRRLVAGFVTIAKDNVNIPIDSCSIDLKTFEKQIPPNNYEFDFIANNDSYRVKVNCHTEAKIYMGERMECSIYEKWCECKVNGITGWGCAEWQYRNPK